MMSIFMRTSSIFSRHPLYSPCTYVICRRGLYFAACKRSLQQASIVQFVMAVWLPLVEASLFLFLARWLACSCSYSACCIVQNRFFQFFPIAHLSKTVDVVIFSFVHVHLKPSIMPLFLLVIGGHCQENVQAHASCPDSMLVCHR